MKLLFIIICELTGNIFNWKETVKRYLSRDDILMNLIKTLKLIIINNN